MDEAKKHVDDTRENFFKASKVRLNSKVYKLARASGYEGDAGKAYDESPELKMYMKALDNFSDAVNIQVKLQLTK